MTWLFEDVLFVMRNFVNSEINLSLRDEKIWR